MLNAEQIERAAQLLRTARLQGTTIPALPPDCRPNSLRDAYAIGDRLTELLAWDVGGWFCACTNETIQKMLGLAEPYYARLYSNLILPEPVEIDSGKLPPIVIECEFAFRLADDLPAREAPYTPGEIREALASVSPAIEIVAGHLENWPEQDVFSVIADNGTDGGLVYGEGIAMSDLPELSSIPVNLKADGEVVRSGTGANVLGDPFGAFVWLVNVLARERDGLEAGHICNTGTATDIYRVEGPVKLEADFGPLGSVGLQVI